MFGTKNKKKKQKKKKKKKIKRLEVWLKWLSSWYQVMSSNSSTSKQTTPSPKKKKPIEFLFFLESRHIYELGNPVKFCHCIYFVGRGL
jgi:hypothetical protein